MLIPPIKMRKVKSAIALASGQTMAIGGLISSETTRDVYKIPLLADLPVLGALFKSTSFNRSETELLILITPTVVDPASYQPEVKPDMKEFSQENPWGGRDNAGKD
jgi:pilus assembly protein CpaC